MGLALVKEHKEERSTKLIDFMAASLADRTIARQMVHDSAT